MSVKKLGVVAAALCAVLAGGSAQADPVPPTPPADLHACTLPGAAPYWFDYVDGADLAGLGLDFGGAPEFGEENPPKEAEEAEEVPEVDTPSDE